ncbi:MAG: ABC transporter ATP-binding protein [Phycisphaeraceae bacterium]
MLKGPFWTSCRDLLRYRKAVVLVLVTTVLSGAFFGAGLSMVLPVFLLFFGGEENAASGVNPLAERVEGLTEVGWVPTSLHGVIRAVADRIPEDPLLAFGLVMGVLLTMTVLANVLRFIQQLTVSTIAERLAESYRDRLYGRLIHAPTERFMRSGASDHVSKIWIDVRLLVNAHVSIFGKGAAELFRGLGILVWAFAIDPVLSGASLLVAPLAAVVIQKLGKRIRRRSRDALSNQGLAMARLNETMAGLQTIKVYTAEGYERRRFRQLNRVLFGQLLAIRKTRDLASALVEVISTVGVVIAATLAAWYILRRGADPSASITVLVLLGGAAASLKPVTTLNNVIRQAEPAAQRILEALAFEPEPTLFDKEGKFMRLERHVRSVVFDDVVYRYPEAESDALRGVSLVVEAGRKVAIVGGNGAGKSTLVALIPRLIEPGSGRVLVDDEDLSGVTLRSLRRQIAVVAQKTVLFQGTIAANIAYGSGHRKLAEIESAARAALAHEFISSLPDGYDTLLGEGGTGLSGGQAQRLAIARAVLRDPAILILDEATSQIDADSETKINLAIESFSKGRTTFVIAHRMSTVVNADQIVVMDAGQIADVGTHQELLGRCGVYQKLTQTQLSPGLA